MTGLTTHSSQYNTRQHTANNTTHVSTQPTIQHISAHSPQYNTYQHTPHSTTHISTHLTIQHISAHSPQYNTYQHTHHNTTHISTQPTIQHISAQRQCSIPNKTPIPVPLGPLSPHSPAHHPHIHNAPCLVARLLSLDNLALNVTANGTTVLSKRRDVFTQ